MKQLPILADEELEEEEHQQALRKPVQRIELSERKKPGSYAGLENDPKQTGECLSRNVYANSDSGGVLVSHC